MRVGLRCPVRSCGEPLKKESARWACLKAHSFDLNRRGFLNLLQPQDRRSAQPGDSKDAALARQRLAGWGSCGSVHKALAQAIQARAPKEPRTLLDVGCGEGAFLRSLPASFNLELHGVDISAASVELAARAQKDATFVVANADRGLPYADRSVGLITSIDSRLAAAEFARVLSDEGLILIAVPGTDDLVELRERVQGARLAKARAPRVEEELAASFQLLDRTTVRETRVLERDALRDLLTATYRGFRQSERDAVASLNTMSVTLSHDILVFSRR